MSEQAHKANDVADSTSEKYTKHYKYFQWLQHV